MAIAQTYPHWETRLLIVITAVLVAFGIAAVYGASGVVAVQNGDPGSAFALRQLIGALLGAVVVMFVARIDYRVWSTLAWWGVVLATTLLVAVLLPLPISQEINGARRWLSIANVMFQPSEFAKLAIVIWAAKLAAKKAQKRPDEKTAQIRHFKLGILPFVAVTAPTAALILVEPDLSTAFLYCLLVGIVLFAAGAKVGHFMLVGGVAFLLVWQLALQGYQIERVSDFFSWNRDLATADWQIQQSILGLGSGGFLGQGFGQGMQKLGYLPYAYSDFIFSTIGEELGFFGASALIAFFGAFIWLGLRIARTAPDLFGSLLAAGITAMIGVTAMLHIAVTLGIVPTTGLPLPFISYGRSNLLVSLGATGILMNIGMQRRISAPKRSEV